MKSEQLTAKQARFVEEYLIDLNATQSAIRAGYAPSTADKKASLWVGISRDSCPANMRHVWDAVQQAKQERSERLKIDADYVLKKLVGMSEMSLKQAFNKNGVLKPLHEMPDEILDMIANLSTFEKFQGMGDDRELLGLTRNLRVTPKLEILKQIGHHVQVNAFKGNIDVTGSIDIADKLMRATRRKRAILIAEDKHVTYSNGST